MKQNEVKKDSLLNVPKIFITLFIWVIIIWLSYHEKTVGQYFWRTPIWVSLFGMIITYGFLIYNKVNRHYLGPLLIFLGVYVGIHYVTLTFLPPAAYAWLRSNVITPITSNGAGTYFFITGVYVTYLIKEHPEKAWSIIRPWILASIIALGVWSIGAEYFKAEYGVFVAWLAGTSVQVLIFFGIFQAVMFYQTKTSGRFLEMNLILLAVLFVLSTAFEYFVPGTRATIFAWFKSLDRYTVLASILVFETLAWVMSKSEDSTYSKNQKFIAVLGVIVLVHILVFFLMPARVVLAVNLLQWWVMVYVGLIFFTLVFWVKWNTNWTMTVISGSTLFFMLFPMVQYPTLMAFLP